MKTESLAHVKAQLSALVDEVVHTHEQVTVTRNGKPVVVILAVEDLNSLQETVELLADPQARARVEQGRREIARGHYTDRDEMAQLMEERRRREAAAE
ncbi:MAG: prevent-host-death protein [Acidimicrobiales bacterium]|nr:MAG: prevent-host-death protein [Acidimicrobiales bacterium]